MRKIIIIGAGASGVSLAVQMAEMSDVSITLLESSDKPLRKLLATGNGRCNFTNAQMSASCYTGEGRAFVREIVTAYGTKEAKRQFLDLAVPSRTMESGMVYPYSMSAKSVCDALLHALTHQENARLYCTERVVQIEKSARGAFSVRSDSGRAWTAEAVVLATGGAYGVGKKEVSNGYRLVKELGHTTTRLHPGIVALTVTEAGWCKRVTGVKQHVRLDITSRAKQSSAPAERLFSYEGDLLFTDYGISGIAVLKASNQCLDLVARGEECVVHVDFFPEWKVPELNAYLNVLITKRGDWTLAQLLSGMLQHALAQALPERVALPGARKTALLSSQELMRLTEGLKGLPLTVTGARKKDRGQITCGGLSLEYVNAGTLESTLCPGLFFAGEVLDVQGICGGYNLHWAWASADRIAQTLTNRFRTQ
ncbi:MAG: aminoacetone oxidase family FAD-binding enzyme [Ndongobacter sp.]|nr:aminoacetone oxidase family FAD-binding enzyme [Ndongobacter sp.]